MSRWQIGGLSAALVIYLAGLAHGEMYVGGQIGYAMPSALTGVSGEQARSGLTLSDIDLQNSVAFGAKIGTFFAERPGFEWLGVEAELYQTFPNIKGQTVTSNMPNRFSGAISGTGFSVTTVAANVIVRIPNQTIQPYAGLGIGGNFGVISGSEATFAHDTALAPSFNILAGVRYFATRNIAVFGEYKYNVMTFSFPKNDLTATYRANIFMVGLSFHFPR